MEILQKCFPFPPVVDIDSNSKELSEADLSDDTLSFQMLYHFFLKTPRGSHMRELVLNETNIDDHALGLLSDPGKTLSMYLSSAGF